MTHTGLDRAERVALMAKLMAEEKEYEKMLECLSKSESDPPAWFIILAFVLGMVGVATIVALTIDVIHRHIIWVK
jgi:hypothetical protein